MFNENGYCAVANVLGKDFTADDKVSILSSIIRIRILIPSQRLFLNLPVELVNAQAKKATSIAAGDPVNLVFVTTSVNQQV